MADDLDSMVKGAPVGAAVHKAQAASPGTTPILAVSGRLGDPLNHAPSSPSMVYLNLLILEASLRAQFLELRARRRHHTFFLALLTVWVAFFVHRLFFAAREDGRGVGGSIYWALEGAQRVCFMGGIITAVLVWATGIWERGIRWPRRWFTISNRGLRGFNCKLVVIRRPWWAEALSTIAFFLTYGFFSRTASSSYRHVDPSLLRETEKELQLSSQNHPTLVLSHEDEDQGGHEEDLAPGGDYVKLLLLAKPFSPSFRENWELYRAEYWERENERRVLLRRRVKECDRRHARQLHGWLWWLPWRQTQSPKQQQRRQRQQQQHHHHHQQQQQQQQQQSHHHKPHVDRHFGGEKARKRSSSSSLGRQSASSSSRGQEASLDVGDGQTSRRPRSGSGASEKRRKKSGVATRSSWPATEPRSVTPTLVPDTPSPLTREA